MKKILQNTTLVLMCLSVVAVLASMWIILNDNVLAMNSILFGLGTFIIGFAGYGLSE